MLPALLACAAATLLHHVHNAEFLDQYPNLPARLSAPLVYAAWIIAAATGFAGYVTFRAGHRQLGLGLVAVYGIYALDGLVHYALAPLAAHTVAMNATIWIEALAGAGLLAACGHAARKTWSVPVSSSGPPSP